MNSSPSSPRRHGWVWVIVILLAIVLIVLIVRGLAPQKKAASRPQSSRVAVATVRAGDLPITLDTLGTVTPTYVDNLVSRVGGELTAVDYQEGQQVKKGQLLAVIDPRPYQAVVDQMKGQLAKDQALLKNARLDLARYEKAYEAHAVPQQQLATQQAVVDQDSGTIQVDQANLAAAELNVTYTQIRAPIDGRVGLRQMDPGNLVIANSGTVVTVAQITPITVIFTLAEDQIDSVSAAMQSGQPVRVDALDRTLDHALDQGTLITIDNQINTSTGTVRGRATFPNAKGALFPNQFVNARLYLRTLTNVSLAPLGAVQRDNDKATVYVVDLQTKKAELRNVNVLAVEGNRAALSGVKPGESVVTDGFDKLQNGALVQIGGQANGGGAGNAHPGGNAAGGE
ncbi:MAG TPA: efflux RND transporter periplasmic adaptor subunit [Opitutaceae bacterium]